MSRHNFRLLVLAFLGVCLSAILAACSSPPDPNGAIIDQCLRREIFKECLNNIPKGPPSTKYNVWDDVVDSCENAAYFQSHRKRSIVKIECRGVG